MHSKCLSDPEHRKEIKKYGGGNWEGGYRDYGVLKFSMRSVDLFMPWVRDIILVTNGQVPTWADPKAPGSNMLCVLFHRIRFSRCIS